MNDAPKHAFEITLKIGASTWEYAKRAVDDIAKHLEDCGENCGMVSGGWDGCHSVDIQKRDVTPEQYRDELEIWRVNMIAEKDKEPAQPTPSQPTGGAE
jgi:hypothetical protein